MEFIRKATVADSSRIAEILIYNKRMNYRSIFQNDFVSFQEMQVLPLALQYQNEPELLASIWVYDDGILKGMIHIEQSEIKELYVDSFFQNQKIGGQLLQFAIDQYHASVLWVLEKNTHAISFYQSYGFVCTEEKQEEGTTGVFRCQMIRTDSARDNGLLLRKADTEEVPLVVALYQSMIGKPGCTWNKDYPTMEDALLDYQKGKLYVLVKGNQLIGAVSLVNERELDELSCWQITDGTQQEIARVVIAQEHQGHHYAKTMLSLLFERLQKEGGTAIHLLVAKENPSAVHTYQNLGFQFLDDCFYYGHDYYACEKRLMKKPIPMRRKERQLSTEEAMVILTKGEYGILAMQGRAYPYAIPLNYVIIKEQLYFHGTSADGLKKLYLHNNPHVCFIVVGNTKVLSERYSEQYESVVAFGRITEVSGKEKEDALMAFLLKYSSAYLENGQRYLEAASPKTTVYRFVIDTITAKANR